MGTPVASLRPLGQGRAETPLEMADRLRGEVAEGNGRAARAAIGQFLTPAPTARFLASLLTLDGSPVRLLDPGAGAGALLAAAVERVLASPPEHQPSRIEVVAYENDDRVLGALERTRSACLEACAKAGVDASIEVVPDDFLAAACGSRSGDLFRLPPAASFTAAILNPPYGKLRRGSAHDVMLRAAEIDCTNTYAAFVLLASRLLVPRGELVAIVPRSFCNGPYFRAFRHAFLGSMRFRRLHVFENRKATFAADAVLQENLVFRATKSLQTTRVLVTQSPGVDDRDMAMREARHAEVVRPDDPDAVVRVLVDDVDARLADVMDGLPATLGDLGVSVSTGPIVDFRHREALRNTWERGCAPLLHPAHLRAGRVNWPADHRKPEALRLEPGVQDLLVGPGTFVLVKRFSAKEERRRVVPAVLTPDDGRGAPVALENHLNYLHRDGGSLGVLEAWGLAAFLASSLVDQCFRHVSGHTQVNATDLRALRYPDREQLHALGRRLKDKLDDQGAVDAAVREVLMAGKKRADPVAAKERVSQAREVLRSLGLPTAQTNERSALVLLALLDLGPNQSWSEATSPLRGITPLMDFMAAQYGKRYAPNTRETVRRQSMHQFLQAGLVVQNPDDPTRAVNSKDNVYQVIPEALELLRAVGTAAWSARLAEYVAQAGMLRKRYARPRQLARIPIDLGEGTTIDLAPGGQNVLVRQILEEFCPRFTPGAKPVYVGDTEKKWAFFDDKHLASLGMAAVDPHGKFPDVVVHYEAEDWLVLVEAVTAHGPVDPKRHIELKDLFASANAGLVFVTAFLDRATFGKYLRDIAWETEVWIAESPDHLIHFDGTRFLGPYA